MVRVHLDPPHCSLKIAYKMCIRDRFRADKLVEDHMTEQGVEEASADGWSNE